MNENKILGLIIAVMGTFGMLLGVAYIIAFFLLDGVDLIKAIRDAAIMIGYGGFFVYLGRRCMKSK